MRSAAREGTGRTLCEESRAMHRTGAYRAVYWGGAAYWLMVDVALRQRTNGTKSVDQLLSVLRRDARLTPPYRAQELVGRLDKLSGTTLFSELAAACERVSFPDYEPSLQALGLRPGEPLGQAEQPLRDALFAAQRAK
jgi:predicted metalloprotease with PDZ domain